MTHEAGLRAFQWIITHQRRFHPCAPGAGHTRFAMKIYGELLLLVTFLLRDPVWRNDPRTRALAEFGCSVCESIDLESIGHFDPQGIPGLALMEEFVQAMNGCPSQLISSLRHSLDVGLLKAIDWMPVHMMEVAYRLQRIGLRSGFPALGDIYINTIAARQLPSGLETVDHIYGVTHTIFYLTDMGHRLTTEVVQQRTPDLADWLPSLLGMTLRQNNVDLAAELLTCWAFLGLEPGLLSRVAWEQIASKQLPDGAIPGPLFSPPLYRQLTDEEAQAYRFETCYHSALVTVLAAVAWERYSE